RCGQGGFDGGSRDGARRARGAAARRRAGLFTPQQRRVRGGDGAPGQRRREGVPLVQSPHLALRHRGRREREQGGLGDGRPGARCAAARRLDAHGGQAGRRGAGLLQPIERRQQGGDDRARHAARRPRAPERASQRLGVRMTSRAAVVVCAMSLASVSLQAQSLPDFSGVYRPINAFGAPPGPRAGGPPPTPAPGQPLAPPTRTAPLSDGSRGRAPNAPKLTPEYLAKWQAISKARVAGDSSSDNTLKCLPPGMPAMMNMAYGMEVMQTKDKVTFFSELNDALRRVYLDG